MKLCALCPRRCLVNREQGERGYCGQTAELRVARAALHQWEEPCLSGTVGSGTVFFAGCSLGCVFCQNQEIAAGRAGKLISVERLVEIFLELQEKGLKLESEDYNSIGGILIGLLDHLPEVGEEATTENGILLSADSVEKNRINEVHIFLPEPDAEETPEEEEESGEEETDESNL